VIPTPYLHVDVERLDRNLRRTARWAREAGVALRPHVKTHKSPDIARRQLALGAAGITVATIGEAEVFVEAGCDDVLVAYPLWLTPEAADRLRVLGQRARLTIGVDSVESATRAADLLAGSGVGLLVEVDCGHHRSGTTPELAGRVAAAARGLVVAGAFTFPGHSYSPQTRRSSAEQESAALAAAGASLRAAGVEPRVLSGGSTPSLEHSDLGTVTELRPGVYAFGDAQQWELGAVDPGDIALTCRSTVVSHAGGRLVLDAGSKVLGADRAAYSSGSGRLLDHPEARIVLLSEHHAVVDLGRAPLPPLGSRVRVVPNHVCNAVNLVDTLWVGEDPEQLAAWPVAARGRNG
jgi:D-serine deaminase-like pyridoxal phosphate-dependent protein